MKRILTTVLVAAGLGLAGLTGATAAPASGTAIGNAANLLTQIQQTRHYYGHGYYKPYCRWVTRCSGYGYYQRCWKERICY